MSIEPAFLPGLCSVTFRSIDAEQVIALAVEAGTRGIEWCSTVHVPPGHLATAMRIAAQCRDAGLDLPSYGTYVRAGADDEQQDMGAALDTAAALGAPNVRVWAGRQGSGVAGEADRARVADAIRAYAALAAASGITLSIEYHRATLTDTLTSTLDLLRRIDHPNCYAYWQPEPGTPLESAAAELRALGSDLSHLHVFHWQAGGARRPLEEAEAYWRRLVRVPGRDSRFALPRYAFSEFVRNDDPDQFRRDFKVLVRLLDPRIAERGDD
jgi:sugar phosphate isomerase/epimerase